ncbi:MAG TPA: hypothetical protein VN706_01135 [Gemmatimonadaceae bacterium]|nr:hypothetical protein [Gemmatimonadaceae bacterium]
MTPALLRVLARVLARVLPRDFRERVFEPALADLRREEQSRHSTLARVIGRATFIAECLRLAAPLLVWRRGQFTRLAIALAAIAVLVAFVIQRQHYIAVPTP